MGILGAAAVSISVIALLIGAGAALDLSRAATRAEAFVWIIAGVVLTIAAIQRTVIALQYASSDRLPLPIGMQLSLLFGALTLAGIVATARPTVLRNRRAGRARHDSEERFRRALAASSDPIGIIDGGGRYIYVNDAGCAFFKYSRDQIIGAYFRDFTTDADPSSKGTVERAIAAGAASVEREVRRGDGSVVPIGCDLIALGDGSILVFGHDLSAQRDAQALQARAEQTQRMESLGQLAGGVAHDFNNLLSVILNSAAFVEQTLSEATRERPDDGELAQAATDVHQIKSAAELAARLTRQLLTFARREPVRPELVDLNVLVREVQELLTRTLGEHLGVDLQLDPDLWPVKADRGQIEQILVNLALNARDAMPDGGVLTVHTANVMVNEEDVALHGDLQVGRHVQLRVTDTGVGMPPEVAERAFEPFFTTKPPADGSGLGLATVHGIVKQAGGRADLRSAPGQGCTLSIQLPAASWPAAGPAPEALRPPSAEERTVLLVEDVDELRAVIQRILVGAGYRVLAAGGGSDAVTIARSHPAPIDLLLTDVGMPGMSGPAVAKRVTAIRPGIPVLYVSGNADPPLHALLGQKTARLVAKPFTAPQLLDALGDVLEEGP